MHIIDKKIYRMGGKVVGGIAEMTVIFADGSIYCFKSDIRNGAPKPAAPNTEEWERRRIAS